jgi:hypothetical protein
VPDAGADQAPVAGSVAKGATLCDDVRTGHKSKFFGALDAGEKDEIPDRIFVSATGAGIANVLEPLDLTRHLGESLEFGRG